MWKKVDGNCTIGRAKQLITGCWGTGMHISELQCEQQLL